MFCRVVLVRLGKYDPSEVETSPHGPVDTLPYRGQPLHMHSSKQTKIINYYRDPTPTKDKPAPTSIQDALEQLRELYQAAKKRTKKRERKQAETPI